MLHARAHLSTRHGCAVIGRFQSRKTSTPICRSVVTKKGRQFPRMSVHLNSKPMEFNTHACKLTTFFCDNRPANQCTGVFRLVDTKFADCAELNSCSQNLRSLHLYDSILCSLEFILHMCKFYWSTNLKTPVYL